MVDEFHVKGDGNSEDLNVRVDPLHVGLEVPLAAAPVATVRATSVLLLTAERFHVLH